MLCGGYGYLSRFIGMASDQILEFDLISPQGEFIVANSTDNSELFWALRGACTSSFGIVASIKFELTYLEHPVLTHLTLTIPPPGFVPIDTHVNVTHEVINIAHWFQTWASIEAPNKLTATLKFEPDFGIAFKMLYLGPKEGAMADFSDRHSFRYESSVHPVYIDGGVSRRDVLRHDYVVHK